MSRSEITWRRINSVLVFAPWSTATEIAEYLCMSVTYVRALLRRFANQLDSQTFYLGNVKYNVWAVLA